MSVSLKIAPPLPPKSTTSCSSEQLCDHTHSETRASNRKDSIFFLFFWILMRVIWSTACLSPDSCMYGVATVSRIHNIIGLFCRISSFIGLFCKRDLLFYPTNRSHPVDLVGCVIHVQWGSIHSVIREEERSTEGRGRETPKHTSNFNVC